MGSEMTSFFENAKSIRIGNKEVKSITTSTGTIWKKEEDNYLLTITSTKSILSYADSESATITATLTNNNVAVSGETLTYTIKHNNTTIDTGSDTTDSNGQITFTYASAGVGDVTVEVDYGILLQETFVVHDYLYVPKLDGTETIHNVVGSPTISNNEFTATGSGSSYSSGYIGAFDNSGDWEITLQAKWSNGNCGVWLIKSDETNRDSNDVLLLRGTIYRHSNGGSEGSSTTFSSGCEYGTYYTVKYTKNGNNLTIERNNTSTTITWSLLNTLPTLAIGVDAWNGTVSIKDIVVKPL